MFRDLIPKLADRYRVISSPTRHAQVSGHPVVASAEPGERWLYCYPDDAFAQY